MPHKETLWSFYNVSHYTRYRFACEIDAQIPMLGILLDNVKEQRKSHLLSRNIPSTLPTPAYTFTGVFVDRPWPSAQHFALSQITHSLQLHTSLNYLCRDSAGISAKGLRPHQRQMGGLQTLVHRRLGFCTAVSWTEGKLSHWAQGTLLPTPTRHMYLFQRLQCINLHLKNAYYCL